MTIEIIFFGVLCYPLIATGLQYSPPLLFAALHVLIAGASHPTCFANAPQSSFSTKRHLEVGDALLSYQW